MFTRFLARRFRDGGAVIFIGIVLVEIFSAFANFIFEFFPSLSEFTDTLADAASELREFLRPEEEKHDEEDKEHLRTAEWPEGKIIVHGGSVGGFVKVSK